MLNTALFLLVHVPSTSSHASLLIPMPRNAIDSELPAWSHGKHPGTGTLEPLGCDCVNGTSDCNSGQSCFWFSQGCSIGCETCDHDGRRLPNWDHCGSGMQPTLLDKYRTANRNATAGTPEDVWKFQPWRAPGMAPVVDPCGMAGGGPTEAFNGGAYNTTQFAKQGDLGSVVLKPRPTGTVWKVGETVTTSMYIAFNHGGGYYYRLCPSSQPLTEACFQANPMEFASKFHTLRFKHGDTVQINNTIVEEGGGKGWAMNPIPNPIGVASTCDDDEGHPCDGCPCGSGYPGGADPVRFPCPVPGHVICGDDIVESFSIEDLVRVPDVPPGEYVLGWRWDAETSSQVWSACADITIVA